MAGDEVAARHTLLADVVLLAKRLEALGFTYYSDSVIVIEPEMGHGNV